MNRLNHVSHFILLILASIIIFMLNMIFSFTPITNNSDIYNGQTQTEITSFLDFSEMLLLMTGLVLIIVAVMNVTANLKKIIEIKRWFFYFGLYLLILLVLSELGLKLSDYEIDNIIKKYFVGTLIITFIPIILLLGISFISFSGRNKRDKFSMVPILIFAGGVAAILSLLINQPVYNLLSESLYFIFFIVISPIVEEILKATSVYWVNKKFLPYLSYSFIIAIGLGFGFAAFENWIYFTLNSNLFQMGFNDWFRLVIDRTFITSIAHISFVWIFTYSYLKDNNLKFGLILAISAHIIFNLLLIINHNLAIAFIGIFIVIFLKSLLYFNRKITSVKNV